jgi:hypothetical protein
MLVLASSGLNVRNSILRMMVNKESSEFARTLCEELNGSLTEQDLFAGTRTSLLLPIAPWLVDSLHRVTPC